MITQTPTERLFVWQMNAVQTIRNKGNTDALRTPGKRHPCYYDLDPAADYNSWTYPDELMWRNNGKTDKKYVGNEDMPLIRCLRKANKDFNERTPEDQDKFFLGDRSLKAWAKGAECSIPFLMAAILADTKYKLRGSPVYDYVCQVIDNGGFL